MTQVRIQRKRTKGWKMPENTVCVDRSTKWGNPFVVHHPGSVFEKPMLPEMAVRCFREMVTKEGAWTPVPLPWPKGKVPKQWTTIEDVQRELRGKNLACFCRLCERHKDGLPLGESCSDCDPCHGDLLLVWANK